MINICLVLHIALAVPLQKLMNGLKNLCSQDIQVLFTEMSLIKLDFNMMSYGKSKDLAKKLNQTKF